MAIRPPILVPGDTVGVVTLGSPADAAVINERIDFLRNLGLNVVIGKHTYDFNGFLAGSDLQRAEDLMAMFEDIRIKAIIPTRGGVGVAGILSYLDYNTIRQNPKIVTGYSDITILLNVLTQYADLITFHSLLLINFRAETAPYNFNQFFEAVSTLTSPRAISNPPEMQLQSIIPGNVTGQIVGGNLTSFVDSLGTPYEIDTSGKIVFLEEVNEPVNKVYRLLNHLRLGGKFRDCAGIVLGECTGCRAEYGVDYQRLIESFFLPLRKPLMINLATGHGYYKAAIPIGAMANLNTIDNSFTILEPTVNYVPPLM
jgi:muramoyltetrapeptide carboxypeptidase